MLVLPMLQSFLHFDYATDIKSAHVSVTKGFSRMSGLKYSKYCNYLRLLTLDISRKDSNEKPTAKVQPSEDL